MSDSTGLGVGAIHDYKGASSWL